ncbi:type II secretion system minor pseudopilin GspK [Rhodoferax bucti]|uniref:type II secretion system minor pseudopilin GspK n=1 Tax=Rhodoferax bucti TaxID=2576305 RepID=UPI001109D86A|nr:type II secretion system minor pseudopilin GspK [Rhodoferax bucti]
MSRRPARTTHRGAAILTAMLLMALVATLSAAALWQQRRALDLETAERARVQANWLLQGGTDWARLILREDARSGSVDHLAEPWAVPLQEAKLSSFLNNGNSTEDLPDSELLQSAYLSGGISDLQGRLNVSNLLLDQQTHGPTLRAFARLFEALQLPQSELLVLVAGLRASQATRTGAQGATATPLQARTLSQLTWLGLSAHTVAALAPYAVVLPERTPVNLNTASAPVLQAIVADLDAAGAQRLLEARARSHFRNLAEVAQAAGKSELVLNDALHSVNSRYFEVRARLRLGSLITQERTVLQRDGLNVKPLWKTREAPTHAIPTNASVQ